MTDPASAPPALLRVRDLRIEWPGRAPLAGLDFEVGPGLTLVRGGEGTGKSTLLRVLAGTRAPDGGTVERPGGVPFAVDAADPASDAQNARAWLDAVRAGQPAWDATLGADLLDAFGLPTHLDKSMHMLSTGTRRKLGLVAAFACGAPLALLDAPFAALDGRSRAVLAELLADAAGHPRRGWVLADFEAPASLGGVRWATVVDLGD
jgi:ABC-type multidrug transport system ATPase subunit